MRRLGSDFWDIFFWRFRDAFSLPTRLHAYTQHIGRTKNEGHHIAHCLHQGAWFTFSDERVSPKRPEARFGAGAHIVFYRAEDLGADPAEGALADLGAPAGEGGRDSVSDAAGAPDPQAAADKFSGAADGAGRAPTNMFGVFDAVQKKYSDHRRGAHLFVPNFVEPSRGHIEDIIRMGHLRGRFWQDIWMHERWYINKAVVPTNDLVAPPRSQIAAWCEGFARHFPHDDRALSSGYSRVIAEGHRGRRKSAKVSFTRDQRARRRKSLLKTGKAPRAPEADTLRAKYGSRAVERGAGVTSIGRDSAMLAAGAGADSLQSDCDRAEDSGSELYDAEDSFAEDGDGGGALASDEDEGGEFDFADRERFALNPLFFAGEDADVAKMRKKAEEYETQRAEKQQKIREFVQKGLKKEQEKTGNKTGAKKQNGKKKVELSEGLGEGAEDIFAEMGGDVGDYFAEMGVGARGPVHHEAGVAEAEENGSNSAARGGARTNPVAEEAAFYDAAEEECPEELAARLGVATNLAGLFRGGPNAYAKEDNLVAGSRRKAEELNRMRVTEANTSHYMWLQCLERESLDFLAEARKLKRKENSTYRCRLCPCKVYKDPRDLVSHVERAHSTPGLHPIRGFMHMARATYNTPLRPVWELLAPPCRKTTGASDRNDADSLHGGDAALGCVPVPEQPRLTFADKPLERTATLVRHWNQGLFTGLAGRRQNDYTILATEKGARLLLDCEESAHPDLTGAVDLTHRTAVNRQYLKNFTAAALLSRGGPCAAATRLIEEALQSPIEAGVAFGLPLPTNYKLFSSTLRRVFTGPTLVEWTNRMRYSACRAWQEASDIRLDGTVDITQSTAGQRPAGAAGAQAEDEARKAITVVGGKIEARDVC